MIISQLLSSVVSEDVLWGPVTRQSYGNGNGNGSDSDGLQTGWDCVARTGRSAETSAAGAVPARG